MRAGARARGHQYNTCRSTQGGRRASPPRAFRLVRWLLATRGAQPVPLRLFREPNAGEMEPLLLAVLCVAPDLHARTHTHTHTSFISLRLPCSASGHHLSKGHAPAHAVHGLVRIDRYVVSRTQYPAARLRCVRDRAPSAKPQRASAHPPRCHRRRRSVSCCGHPVYTRVMSRTSRESPVGGARTF